MTYYTEPEDNYVEQASTDSSEDLNAQASVPWVGIAMMFHCLLVAVAWFIVPTMSHAEESGPIVVSRDKITIPPLPELEIPEDIEFLDSEIQTENDVEQPQLVDDPQDEVNQDDSDSPNEDLAKNDSADDSVESPHPNKNHNSSVGLTGSAGGGGGFGGGGGLRDLRGPPGGRKTRPTDVRVDKGLTWLADHQNQAGYWSATNFGEDSTRTGAKHTYNVEFSNVGESDGDKGWDETTDIGLTGLALLAFVGEGHDHMKSKYATNIRRAIQYLRRNQSLDGCFGAKEDDHFVYNHAICTMAVAELYAISGASVLRQTVQKATDFILRAQNPGQGWRYGIQPGNNDVSVTGWMILALKSCKMAGMEFDSERVYKPATEYLDLMTIEQNGYAKTGYKTPGSDSARLRSATKFDAAPSMESIHIMCDLFTGKETLSSPQMKELANICAEKEFLPKWEDKRINYYYWYYASLALYQMGGSTWDRWETAMSKTLIENQRGYRKGETHETPETLDEHGSWDSVGAWCPAGGRVYATAMNCLTLQVWYRYQRVADKSENNKDK